MSMSISIPETHEPLSEALATTLLANLGAFQSFARRRLHDDALAADVVQESLYRALKSSSQLENEENLLAWFYRILRNVLTDLHRRNTTQTAALERFSVELDTTETPELKDELCACLRGVLPTLNTDYAHVIQRVDLEETPQENVADELGITRENLKVRLHRARRQLRERLEQTCQLCATHGCLQCTCAPSQN